MNEGGHILKTFLGRLAEVIEAFKWAISIGERVMWTIQEFWEASQWHQLS